MASETTSKNIGIMDPCGEPTADQLAMAPRPSTLDGKVMAILDNGKPNGDRLVQMVSDLIRERYDIKDVRLARKPDFTRPAPDELMNRLMEERDFDFVIVAVGD